MGTQRIGLWRIAALAIATVGAMMAPCAARAGGLIVNIESVQPSGFSANVVGPSKPIEVAFSLTGYMSGSEDNIYAAIGVVRSAAKRRLPVTDDVIAVTPLLLLSAQHRVDEDGGDITVRLNWSGLSPATPGRYCLAYNRDPIDMAGRVDGGGQVQSFFKPAAKDVPTFRRALVSKSMGGAECIYNFVVSATPPKPIPYRLLLRANGKVPTVADLHGGVQDRPLVLSWFLSPKPDPRISRVLFRTKMWPEDVQYEGARHGLDAGWSAWTEADRLTYFYLAAGSHEFRVQTRLTTPHAEVNLLPAQFGFSLDQPFLGKPAKPIEKGMVQKSTIPVQPLPAFDQLYPKSRALLIGTWNFADKAHFQSFEKAQIARDLSTLHSALDSNGFEVTELLDGDLTREKIASALDALVQSSGNGDRIIVYFSMHGFSDPNNPAEPYVATSRCFADQPTIGCYRLSDLRKDVVDRAIAGKQVRQILFAIDTCSSGLGVILKAGKDDTVDLAQLAAQPGAFMMTAGMANQKAQIDGEFGMSTFTHYLADGLTGSARLFGNDGPITMTELFLYVQHNTAARTKSAQIPMLGRMMGDGEMLFSPPRQGGNR